MMAALMRYGALTAKIRALYGKRLRLSDFAQMAQLHSEAEILEYLRTQSGWSSGVAGLGSSYVGRVELERALREQLNTTFSALAHFVPREDLALLSFPVLLTEQQLIMAALRRLKAGGGAALPPEQARLPHGHVDPGLLRQCTDYEGLLAATRGSIYYPPLLHARPPAGGTLPDYTTTEALLSAAYYSHLYKTVHQRYAGETRRVLLRSFGEQVDLLNIIHILRLKTYFPGEDPAFSVLFPFRYKLQPQQLRALCAAPDAAGVFALLQGTRYADCFRDVAVTAVEDYYRQAFYQFNHQQLVAGQPSIYTAIAFLNLKELELGALIHVIESVKYGIAYDAHYAKLVGG